AYLERCRDNLPVAAAAAAADTARTAINTHAAAAAMMGDEAADAERTMVRQGAAAGETPPQGPGKASGKKKFLIVLALLAALALAAGGVYLFATSQKATVDVANVVGMTRQQAEETLKARQLDADVEAEEYSDTVPAGTVIRQNPEAGSKLKEGGSVRLVLSRGSSRVAVPDIAGQTASYGESKLREAGLNPDRQPDAYSETVAEGSIISQDPAAGSQVQKGSSVKYVVSKGPEPVKEVTVPSLVGLTQGEAAGQLSAAKLVLGNVTQQYSSSVPAGQVISQSPSAGQKVREGSSVSIVVSQGPQPPVTVTVPDVVVDSQASAESQLGGAGFVVFVSYVPAPTPGQVGKVVSQTPLGGTTATQGSDVSINVGV
ncbi:MAG: PASTA domain-containing protein, partial [Actinomycetota bacterium]